MPVALHAPDLAIHVRLDPYAPREARFHIARVDRPSPDLRDAVTLLTSELVTRAVQQCEHQGEQAVELRVWMPADVVRVELEGPRNLLLPPLEPEGPRYDVMLLERLADRWGVEAEESLPYMWFEIDRHD
ncbi:MAG: hypothetical protein QOI03_1880 [Solirubrobacteraceae bacterium]|jgi:hypothetical protein|nr:hypothetical protein [Solirubrobacteraceae bacterium]